MTSGLQVVSLLAVICMMTTSSGQPVVSPPSLQDFNDACAPFNTTFTCARAVNALCTWDAGASTCQFRSKSCPADIKSAMIALSGCGATVAQSCPNSCVQPQLDYVAKLHVHAGLKNFTNQEALLVRAMSDATIAQTIADVQYCTTELTAVQYTNMLMVSCNPSNDQYNAAISAEFAKSTNAPSSSSPSSSSSSGSGSASKSSATGSAAVLAINTVINGLALGLFIMYAAGL